MTKKGELTKDAQDSMYLLSASVHATVMSHFETFQKSLFAGVLEATRFIPSFDVNKLMGDISKEDRVFVFDAKRLGAYRGEPAPLGAVIADCLKGWHDPRQ
ncbi:MAG: hypothetical protein IPK99_13745 [Flavobacteriales bacterium]|nr:hypothetical protein [Flavobacteriales bacterium]